MIRNLIAQRRSGAVFLKIAAAVALSSLGYAAQPTTVREGRVEGADGVSLYYRMAGTSPSFGILLHGGPGSNINAVWPDLQPLAESRTIVMYDQRGGGRSEVIKDPARLTAAHHVRDLEALRVNLRVPRFALIGESWGAGLAVLYAAAHPEHVERLLLIGPMPPTRAVLERRLDESDQAMGMRRRLAEVRAAMTHSKDPIATCREFFSLYTRQFFVTPDGMARRRGSSCDGPPEGIRNYFVVNDATFASLGDWDFRPVLKRLTMPAMVIEGELSIPSTVESARIMAAALPEAALLLIPNAGHYPQVERPEVFFPEVAKFLAGSRR